MNRIVFLLLLSLTTLGSELVCPRSGPPNPPSLGGTGVWLPPNLGGWGGLCVAQAQADSPTEADRLVEQGMQYYRAGQFAAALPPWQQALAIYQRRQDRPQVARVLGLLGAAYLNLGRYGSALEALQQALPLLQASGNRPSQVQVLGNLGIAYRALGHYVKAVEAYQQALSLLQELRNPQAQGQILGNLGNAYRALGDYEQAIAAYQQSLTIARASHDRPGEGTVLGNLGAVYANLGDLEQAIQAYQQSLALARATGNRLGEGDTLNNLGAAYHTQGDYRRAQAHYQQSLTIAQATGYRRLAGEALGNLGLVAEDQKNYPRAIQQLEQSLAIAQAIGDPQAQGLALNNLGHAWFSAGNFAQAERQLRLAIAVLESLRPGLNDAYNVSVFDTQVLTYNLLQQILVAAQKPEAALEISEQGRARAFVELLARRLSPQSAAQIQANTKAPTLQAIKRIARQQNATLVEYSIVPDDDFKVMGKLRGLESELLIWVVHPTGAVNFRRVDLKPLRQQPSASLRGLVTRALRLILNARLPTANLRQTDSPLKQLHQVLIQPIADLLPRDPNARVVFIPQDSLFLVPFPALLDASGRYLIEQHTLLTAPAIQVLQLTHQQQAQLRRTAHPDRLVLGNPTMPSVSLRPGESPQPLEPLPGAEQEAIEIARLLHTQPLLGRQGTKAAVLQRLPQARLVHLATHGLLSDTQTLGSPGAIALAPSGDDDGLLTASEILDLNLQAELVVLSACDTGRGRITGDGVIGLSRALILAGAPSVVVSLWAVPDAPTTALMVAFYRRWRDHPDKAQALRQAMLATLADHPAPRNWAAFTLIGEAE